MAYTYHRHSNPNRTEVRDASGWLATFTDNCRTVTLRGSERIFTEESGGIDDFFSRTRNNGWGNSPAGGNWYAVGGTASDYNTNGSAGIMHAVQTGIAYRTVITNPHRNIDAQVQFSANGNPTGVGMQQGMMFHYQNSQNHYDAYVTTLPGNVTDNFGRSIQDGWGKSTSGHMWSTSGGEAANYRVVDSAGKHDITTVNSSLRTLMPATKDFDCKVKVATSALSEGSATLVGLVGRYQNANNYYFFRLRYASAPARRPLFMGIQKYINGTATFISNEIDTDINHSPDSYVWLRASIQGNTLRIKLWSEGGKEPSTWQIETTDDSISDAGQVGMRSLVANGNTNTLPLTVSYDSLTLIQLNQSEGDMQLVLQKRINNTLTPIAAASLPFIYANIEAFRLRVQTNGDRIQVRLWNAAQDEPNTWQIETTDTSLTGGSLGLRSFCASNTPNMPVTFSFSNYSVKGEWVDPPIVMHSTWLRLLNEPFSGTVDETWLKTQLNTTDPDILTFSMQYLTNSPAIIDNDGLQIAGDAAYSELLPDGNRQEGADFNDYLGIEWEYSRTSQRIAETSKLYCLDCSGFIRMVYGYRGGYPLGLSASTTRLPRTSTNLAYNAPGILVASSESSAPSTAQLQIGDLVYFGVADRENAESLVAHIGIYLGVDPQGNQRFISSRRTLNGPTFADIGGASTLNGSGQYPDTFRAIRRL